MSTFVLFDRELWWDTEALNEWCTNYPCATCGDVGVDPRWPSREAGLRFCNLLCKTCGAHLGWLPAPPSEWWAGEHRPA